MWSHSETRIALPLLLFIVIALLCLLLARADAASDLPPGRLAYAQADGSLWLVNPDGTDPQRIGSGRSLTWSPDGAKLVLDARTLLDLTTGEARDVLGPAASESGAVSTLDSAWWVPGTDRLLLFSSTGPGLYFSAEKGIVPLVADGSLGFRSQHALSPDGSRLAFVRRSADDLRASVWVMDLTPQGRGVQLNAPTGSRDAPTGSRDAPTGSRDAAYRSVGGEVLRDYIYDLAWDPTGQQLVYTWATAPDTGSGPPTRANLIRVAPTGATPQPLTPASNGTFTTHPVWSPDGGSIAYIQTTLDEALKPTMSIRILDMNGLATPASPFLLFGLPAGDLLTSALAWSPEGQALAFSAREVATGVSTLRLVGRDGRVTTLRRDAYFLGWLPYGAVSPPPADKMASQPTPPRREGGVLASVAYDRAGAMDYAFTHCMTTTPNCPVGISYAEVGGDCAHFVSHGLLAGGLSNYNSIGVGHNSSGSILYASGGIIIRAGDEHNWLLSGGRGVARTAATQLDQGDVISYDWDGVNGWNHVAMVDSNDGQGGVQMASHTRYGCDINWSMGGAADYEFIHVLAAPAAPSHPSPADGAGITYTTPALNWAALGTVHRVQAATDTTFANPLVDLPGLSVPSYTFPGALPCGTYYWRARTSDGNGTSPWSETWSFERVSTVQAPPAPDLLSPDEGYAITVTMPVTLTWTAVPTATGYRVEWVSAEPITYTSTLWVPSFTLPTTSTAGAYTWHVRSAGDCGEGPWSAPRGLTLLSLPPLSYFPIILNTSTFSPTDIHR